MTSPVGGLIQTIFKLQELRQRDEAAQLAREQFGLEQTRVGLTQQQMAEQGINLVQDLAKNSNNPSQFLQHVPFLSRVSGTPEAVLRTTLETTPPSTATQRDTQVASGLQSLGGTLAPEAAASALTGNTLGGLASSGLDSTLLQSAQKVLATLPPAEQASLGRRVLEKRGSGMSLEDATIEELFMASPMSTKEQIMKIGKGLLPNATQAEQISMGWREQALRGATQAFEERRWAAQLSLMEREAQAKLTQDPEKYKTIQALTHELSQASQDWVRTNATLTPAGRLQNVGIINSLIDQIQKLDPTIPVPPKLNPGDETSSHNGFMRFINK